MGPRTPKRPELSFRLIGILHEDFEKQFEFKLRNKVSQKYRNLVLGIYKSSRSQQGRTEQVYAGGGRNSQSGSEGGHRQCLQLHVRSWLQTYYVPVFSLVFFPFEL